VVSSSLSWLADLCCLSFCIFVGIQILN
jgi:hypothetical protein